MKSTGDEFGGLYKEHAMTDDVVSFISITLFKTASGNMQIFSRPNFYFVRD